MSRVAKNLRRLRGDISQDAVAFGCGIGRATYQRFELKTAAPTLPTLQKLAEYFKTTLDDLVRP